MRRFPTSAALMLALGTLALGTLAGCAFTGANPGRTYENAATFDARHEFTVNVPANTEQLRVWFAMPSDHEPAQRTSDWQVDVSLTTPFLTRTVRDTRGNRFLLLEAQSPPAGNFQAATTFRLTRKEVRAQLDPSATRAHTASELTSLAEDLAPSRMSVIDENARAMARQAVGGETNPILASRKIYDALLEHMEYHVKDPKPDAAKTMNSTGTGSSLKAFETRCGNCTDFHSLYAAVSRAAGIPTRVVYGSFFKGPLDGVDQDQSYHCWIEFHAPKVGWIPLDVAVADVFVADFRANENSRPRADLTVANGYQGPNPALVEYYFGNLENRRVTWHYGRDLVMKNPRQAGEPLLWNPKAYGEADGESITVGRKLTFTQVIGPRASTASTVNRSSSP